MKIIKPKDNAGEVVNNPDKKVNESKKEVAEEFQKSKTNAPVEKASKDVKATLEDARELATQVMGEVKERYQEAKGQMR